MKNKLNIKSFAAGVLATALLVPAVLYANELVTRNVIPGISINLNGSLMQLPEGEEAFIYAGRTFLPVRAVAEALGAQVDWDAATQTVYLATGDVSIDVPAVEEPAAEEPAVEEPAVEEPTVEEPAVNENEENENNEEAYVAATVVGTWAWDQGPDFLYVFNADGTGTRGVDGLFELETFFWIINGDTLHINLTPEAIGLTEAVLAEEGIDFDEIIVEEEWAFVIENNVLTITSLQVIGMEFSYILVD